MEWLFSLLFYCECGINQYAGQKSLTDVSGANLLLLELSCFRNIVLSYFENASSPSEISCLVFCYVQYKKNKNKRGGSPLFPFLKPTIGSSKQTRIFSEIYISPLYGGSGGSYYGERIK